MDTDLDIYGLWREQKRDVTVVFADLSGYSEMASQMDVEDLAMVLKETHLELSAINHRYGGMVVKIIGDCLMVLFGAPISKGDEILRGIFAALEMKQWVEAQWGKKQKPPGIKFGINHGVVFTASLKAGPLTDFTVLGEAVNLAYQLQDIASPGQILIPETLVSKVEPTFQVHYWKYISQKGTGKRVRIYEIVGVKRGADQFPVQPLIGKKIELGFCESILMKSQRGKGQIIGILGGEGTGKRVLASHVMNSARKAGFRTSGVTGYPFRKTLPFWTLSELLSGLLDVPALQTSLTQDEYNQVCKVASRTESSPPELQVNAEHKSMLFTLSKKTLIIVARDRPLFLLVSGYHNTDSLSQEFLNFFSYSLPNLPICLLLTYQSGVEIPFRGKEFFSEITLRNWEQNEVMEAIKVFYPGEEPKEAFATKIMGLTNGNPSLIRNFLSQLRQSDLKIEEVMEKAESLDPEWLNATTRLDELSQNAREVLNAASVLPQEFSYGFLQSLLPETLDLSQVLLELLEKDFLIETRYSPELCYSFQNQGLKRFVESRLLKHQRKTLHLESAKALLKLYSENLEDHYYEIACHYKKADEPAKAIEYFIEAAEVARRKFAIREAKELFASAHSVLKTSRISISYSLQCLLYSGCAEVDRILGNFKKSNEHYQTLRKLAQENGDSFNEIRALLKLGDNFMDEGDLPSAETLFQQAADACGESDFPSLRAYALTKIGRVRYMKGLKTGVKDFLLEGLELAREANDHQTKAMALNFLGLYQRRFESAEEALRTFEQAYRIYEEMHHPRGMANTLLNIGIAYGHLGDLEKDMEVNQKALKISEDIGDLYTIASSSHNVGVILLDSGKPREALPYLLKSLEIQKSMEDLLSQSLTLSNIGACYYQLGELEKAVRAHSEGIELARQGGSAYFALENQIGLADAYTAIGLYEKAEKKLDETLKEAQNLQQVLVSLKSILSLVVCQILQGKWEKAETLLNERKENFELQAEKKDLIFYTLLKSILFYEYHQNSEESRQWLQRASQLSKESQTGYEQCQAGILQFLYFEEDTLTQVNALIQRGEFALLKLEKLTAEVQVAKRKEKTEQHFHLLQEAKYLLYSLANKIENPGWRETFITTRLRRLK